MVILKVTSICTSNHTPHLVWWFIKRENGSQSFVFIINRITNMFRSSEILFKAESFRKPNKVNKNIHQEVNGNKFKIIEVKLSKFPSRKNSRFKLRASLCFLLHFEMRNFYIRISQNVCIKYLFFDAHFNRDNHVNPFNTTIFNIQNHKKRKHFFVTNKRTEFGFCTRKLLSQTRT